MGRPSIYSRTTGTEQVGFRVWDGKVNAFATIAVKVSEKPGQVTTFSAPVITSNSITIDWEMPTSAEPILFYEIQKGTSPFVSIANITTTEYTDNDVQSGINYNYVVRPFIEGDIFGDFSEPVQVTIPTPDIVSPEITLSGTTPTQINQGDNYTDAGATCSDDVDGDLTQSIVIVSNVNTAIPGTYQVTYDCTDSSGNTAEQKSRTVTVLPKPDSAPVISAISDVIINEGDQRTVTVTATDPDGDLVTLSLTQKPSFAVLSGNTMLSPGSADTGIHAITVQAAANGKSATESFGVTVNLVDDDDTSHVLTTKIGDSAANGPGLTIYDYFGRSVASIGDLNSDGVPDLAAGAIGDDEGGTNAGAVHVMLMNADGTVASTVEINDSTTAELGLSAGDYFGRSVAGIGDLDGDGIPDIAVGANGDNEGGTDKDAVHIIYLGK